MPDDQINIDAGKKQIYIIDEARAVRTFVNKALFELDGYQVIEFESGAKGFSFLTGECDLPMPELLIFESKFRDIEAVSMLKRIRQNPSTKNIPVIIFTNNKDKKQIITFLQAGADEYLFKPSNNEAFLAKVKSLLGSKEQLEKLDDDTIEKAVLVADDDPASLENMNRILSNDGFTVICCGNSLNALRKWRLKIGVALLDINLPDIDGISLAEAVKNRFSNAKIILIGKEVSPEDMAKANRAGIEEILKKPISERNLLEKIEKLMEPLPPIHKIEIEKQYRMRLLSPVKPLPPVIEGRMNISFDSIYDMFVKYPELDDKKVLMSAGSVWSTADRTMENVTNKEPAIPEGRQIKKNIVELIQNHRKEANGAAVDIQGRVLSLMPVEKSYDLGVFLYEKEPIDSERITNKLMESSFIKAILARMDSDCKEEALEILEGIFGYMDLYFYYYEFEKSKNKELLHWLTVAFVSVITAASYLDSLKEEISSEDRKVILSIVGMSGFLHDVGQFGGAVVFPRASEMFYQKYPVHVEFGYEMMEKLKIFECVKQVIKDHHKDLNHWSSKFDSCTKIVQLANDIDNYTRTNGVFYHGSSIHPSPESYSWEEACLMILDHSRNGVYDWEMVKNFYKAVNHSDFTKFIS